MSFIFDTSKNETPESIAKKRAIAAAIMGNMAPRRANNVGEGIGNAFASIGQGIQTNILNRRADKAEQAGTASAEGDWNPIMSSILGGGAYPTSVAAGGSPTSGAATGTSPMTGGASSFLSAIDKTEGGGSYDTLFGHAQRDGGQFAGVKVSQMPISDVLAFASPSGSYGQSVKGKVGRVATPMGRYQIVGSTLRNAVSEMGIDPSAPFTPEVQDAVATHIARRAISGKSDSAAIDALRGTWEGFRSVPHSQMLSILNDVRSGKGSAQVSSADQSFMPEATGGSSPFAPTLSQQLSMQTPSPEQQNPYPEAGQVSPHDFTGNPQLSGSPFAQFDNSGQPQGLPQDQFNARFGAMPMDQMATGSIPPQQSMQQAQPQQPPMQQGMPSPFTPQAYQQNDQMMGGALAPQGQAPQQMADASGAFPPAPSQQQMQAPQQQGMGQVPMDKLLKAASNPWLNEQQRGVVNMLIQQQMKANDPSSQLDMDYKRAQISSLQAKAAGKGDPTEYGLNPIWGQDEKGNAVLGVLGKDGSFKKVDTGQFDISSGTEQIDLGDSFAIKDKRSGQIIGTVPKNLANAEKAKKIGAGEGEAAVSYQSMSSKLPGLEIVVDELNKLSDKATYTTTGQIIDWGRKELTMKPRDSALARAEYISKVDNQVLPMLRDTFGAAFTVKEGETLRATLGDPDKSPDEKKAVLKSFIEQKKRDIKALGVQSGMSTQPQSPQSSPVDFNDYFKQ